MIQYRRSFLDCGDVGRFSIREYRITVTIRSIPKDFFL